MQQIVSLIVSRGDPHLTQTVLNWVRTPWLEQICLPVALKLHSKLPRIFTTHLPYQLLDAALQGTKAKVKFARVDSWCDHTVFLPLKTNILADISLSQVCILLADRCQENC